MKAPTWRRTAAKGLSTAIGPTLRALDAERAAEWEEPDGGEGPDVDLDGVEDSAVEDFGAGGGRWKR